MKKQYTAPIHLYAILLLFIWSFVIICLAVWKINSNENAIQELAESQARAHFSKDKAFRLWLTGHGRLYIPVGEKYQPDPYLAHVKDRDITTPSGIKLSLINPARIVRELGQQYKKFYGVSGRVTKLSPINPENIPDAWEKSALLKIEQGTQEVFEYTTINGEPYLRLIQPLPLKKKCLFCHQELLHKTNGIGGGVTVALPMKELLAQQHRENINDLETFFILWCTVAIGLAIAFFHLKRQTNDKEKAVLELASSQSHNKAIMESALDSIITIDAKGIVTEANPATEKTFGYKCEMMIGHDLAELIIPPELREKHRAGMKNFIRTGHSSILGTRFETKALHADGYQFPVELAIIHISEGETFFTAYLRDLTEAHKLKEKLTHQATHDPLTGLMNRQAFEDHLEFMLNEIDEESQHCLLYLDLDQFKIVNDSSGHLAGDELLRQLSQVFQKRTRTSDILARLGGDEFGLLLDGCSLDKAREIATGLLHAVQQHHFYWDKEVYTVGVSIGMVSVSGFSNNYSTLMSAADAACYKAKEEGRNRYYVFKHNDDELNRLRGDINWVSRIKKAIQNDQFILYSQAIQPINKDYDNGKLHCEILLRMQDIDGTIITPDKFIPCAERYNLMLIVDKWVIDNTFRWLSQLDDILKHIALCSINLSGFSITNNSLASYITDKLKEYDLPAHIVCFEITETVAITNLVRATQFLDELHNAGCQFALDDFGSGVSSFGYLKNLPVDFLKIDGEFVKDITSNPVNYAMVKSINEIGKVMGKKTIAEYVEDQETVELLRALDVDYIQGYFYSRPTPLEYRNTI